MLGLTKSVNPVRGKSVLQHLQEHPMHLGKLHTWICCLANKEIPAWKIAVGGGYKLRSIRYHTRALCLEGLLVKYHRFKNHRQRPNAYYLPQEFAPLSHHAYRGVGNLISTLPCSPWGRGAKRRFFLLRRTLQLILELANRLKADETKLFLEIARLLRRKKGGLGAIVGALETAKDFFWERGGKPPDNPVAFLMWALV